MLHSEPSAVWGLCKADPGSACYVYWLGVNPHHDFLLLSLLNAFPSKKAPTFRGPAAVNGLLLAGVAGAATWLPAPVHAIGFTGYYATGNWAINAIPNATVAVGGTAPNNTITLRSKDNGGGLSNTTFTITADPLAPVASTVSFNWSYVTRDVDGSTFDPFGYVLNGNFVRLTSNGFPINSTQSGASSFRPA